MHNLNSSKQTGAGLLEILIAMLILSIGLLGMAGLQALSLKNNNSAINRSHAVFLANSMLDRIRANRTGSYTTAFATNTTSSSSSCDGTGATCSIAQIAAYDLSNWKCALSTTNTCYGPAKNAAGLLPDGQGQILRSGDEYTVTVQWTDSIKYVNGEPTSGTTTQISISAEI